MATHQIPILGHATKPTASQYIYPQNLALYGTNNQWQHMVWCFEEVASPAIGLYGLFTVPQNYVGSPVIIPVWSSTATSGDVEWDFVYRAVGGDDSESLDQAGTQEALNINDTAPSAAWERMAPTGLAMTAGNLAAGDTVEFYFTRDGTDAGDTMNATAYLFELLFQYADA